jgi:hypothetical protein
VANILIALAIAVVSFIAGWRVDDWKHSAVLAAQLQDQIAQTAAESKRADRVSDSFERKLANLRITNTTINRDTIHELEKTVYGDPNCDLPVTGVRLRNQSIDAANAASQPVAAVSANSKDGGQASKLWRFFPGGSSTDRAVR